MFNIFDLFEDLKEKVYALLILLGFIVICCGFTFFNFAKPDSEKKEKTVVEKLDEIDIDLQEAGIDKKALQDQFLKDPLSCRKSVEQHKRKRFLFVTTEHEKAITKQFVDAMKAQKLISNAPKAEKRCKDIIEKLKKGLPEHFAPPSEIYIIDTPEVNAFCLPDGTIIVFRGLLEKMNDNELAWVLAHELGHGAAHHTAERLSKAFIQELAIDVFLDKENDAFKIVGARVVAFVANLKYSRSQENEADRLALSFMNKAGIDMQGAVSCLNKFKEMIGEKSEFAEILSTHPNVEKRLKNVQTSIKELKKDQNHLWGTFKDEMMEAAKEKAIELYMKNEQKKKENANPPAK